MLSEKNIYTYMHMHALLGSPTYAFPLELLYYTNVNYNCSKCICSYATMKCRDAFIMTDLLTL